MEHRTTSRTTERRCTFCTRHTHSFHSRGGTGAHCRVYSVCPRARASSLRRFVACVACVAVGLEKHDRLPLLVFAPPRVTLLQAQSGVLQALRDKEKLLADWTLRARDRDAVLARLAEAEAYRDKKGAKLAALAAEAKDAKRAHRQHRRHARLFQRLLRQYLLLDFQTDAVGHCRLSSCPPY